jgi:S-DNA-T family DNA segregation ATPase FtsK/SpoIIIE
MELLLELRVGRDPVAVRLDCRVDAGTDATVADLRRALAEHASARDVVVDGGARLWDDDARPLHDDHLVDRTGLRSGRRVWLSPDPPPRRAALAAEERADASGGIPFTPSPRPPGPEVGPPLPAMPAPPDRPRWRTIGPWGERSTYLAALDERVAELERAVEGERAARHRALPPLDHLIEDAVARGPGLWSRDRTAADLLTVRLGTADERSAPALDLEPGGDEELRRLAVDRLSAAAVMRGVPVALDLDAAPIVGLHGDPELVHRLARGLLGQIVAGHGPDDVVVAALLAPTALRSFEWLRWLPHVRSSASPLSGDHLAVWPEAVGEVVGSLLEAAQRPSGFPRLVLLLDEDAPVDPDTVSRLLGIAPEAGIRVLWLGSDVAPVVDHCAAVVRVGAGPGASTLAMGGGAPMTFEAEGGDVPALDRLARCLAPLRATAGVARVSSIPRLVGLTNVLGGTPVPADVATAWALSDGGLLDAPVGIGSLGPVTIDLVEHGPHAVVAGARGSGKRELLRTWFAALAARHPPERFLFDVVDVDGSFTTGPLGDLPHDVGRSRAESPEAASAALASLPEELDRRAQLLGDRDLHDLAELAAADPAGCPPRLVLVVGELAAVASRPDAVAGLVDVAWRGGHLGVHLVFALATGHPRDAAVGDLLSSVLDAVDLRIALRVDEPAQSEPVIGVGDAAEIPASLPGRAFLRVGGGDPIPFQAAWSLAPRNPVGVGRVRVSTLGFGRRPGSERRPTPEGSQLDDVLRAITLAFELSGRTMPVAPWRPER